MIDENRHCNSQFITVVAYFIEVLLISNQQLTDT